ncbi:MAG TPA: response regulator [Bacteroidales bacterium]|nr:response regulator [Bacteroidales bacterium]
MDSVLYIDDDLVNLKVFYESLKEYFDIIVLSSTSEAEEVLENTPVKVIVSDQFMPDETGIDFIKRINSSYPDIKKIILTAYASQDNALEAINDACVYKYLTKPWKRDAVKEWLDMAIKEYDYETEKKQLLSELKTKNEQLLDAYRNLEISEKKFRTIFAQSSDSSFILDTNKNIIEVNKAFLKLINYEGNVSDIRKINEIARQNYSVIIEKAVEVVHDKNSNLSDITVTLHSDQSKTLEIRSNEINYNNDIYILAVIHDISERRQFEKKIIETIITTQEEDRSRYAQELHDGLGPLLSTLKMHIQWIANPDNTINKDKIIQHAIHSIDSAINSTKEIANNLSPHVLQRFGLVNAVKSHTDHLKGTSSVVYEISSNLRECLDINLELILYRIILECINNSLKHAIPKKIVVRFIKQIQLLTIEIIDDGKGFDVNRIFLKSKGMGLFNIKNRIRHIGGELTINSEENKGTHISINIPLT